MIRHFRTPSFWYEKSNTLKQQLTEKVLSPLGWAYGRLLQQRFGMYHPIPLSKPVICIGNLVMGGAGKTPVVMVLARELQKRGYNPHILSRGYGGAETGPLQVSPSRDTAEDVGDEPLLLVDAAPTWISANRALGAQYAIDTGANVVLMDDGFQNPAMYKDFSLIVIDGAVGFGNGKVFPAGPLREQAVEGLKRANAVLIVGEDKTSLSAKITDIPVFTARLQPHASNPDLAGKTVFAFAGIGRPQKFRDSLIAAGAQLEGWGEYPDHCAYTQEDLAELVGAAEAQNAMIVTTSKDYVRLPENLKSKVQVFAVDAEIDDMAELMRHIEAVLYRAGVMPSA